MFVLSASATNKPAYELSQLGQGLLSYSMLHTLKYNPDILDQHEDGTGYLNLMKWFLETEEKQSELVKSYGLRQEAQPYGTANIKIGLVDDEVRNTVQLMDEKPMVYCASARNENEEDPLELRNKLNSYLDQARTRNIERGYVITANETYKTNVIKLVSAL
jgi:hypothetical protein